MSDVSGNSGGKVEGDVFPASEFVFQSSPENPQEVHVGDEVEPSSVQEHAGEERVKPGEFIGDKSPLHEDEIPFLGSGEKDEEKKQGVQSDECVSNPWVLSYRFFKSIRQKHRLFLIIP